jgi:outer membrane protein assembly factor BamD
MFKDTVRAAIILTSVFLLLVSCSTKNKKDSTPEEQKVMEIYDRGMSFAKKQQYQSAIQTLQKLEDDYPFTEKAKDASIVIIYSNFKLKEYGEVIALIDSYIKFHPTDNNIPYLLHIKAKSHLQQVKSYKKDRKAITDAKESIENLMVNYKDSEYGQNLDTQYKYIKDMLYLYDLNVAVNYHRSRNCISAIPRYLALKELEHDKYGSIVEKNLKKCYIDLRIDEYVHKPQA